MSLSSRFKVGDRVKFVGDDSDYAVTKFGWTGTVDGIDLNVLMRWDDYPRSTIHADHVDLELEHIANSPLFKALT